MTNKTALRIVEGDITLASTEAMVNAANRDLSPGGGVCGAIYAAAGPELETITEFLADHPEIVLDVVLVCRGWKTYEQVMRVYEDYC